LAAAGGLLAFLAFPPVAAWPAAFLSLALLIMALRDAPSGRRFALGFTFGVAAGGSTLYWVLLFGGLAWTSLTVLTALPVAVFGAALPVVQRRGRPVISALGTASLWTAIDWIRGTWPLGGFTWASLGVSQVPNRFTARIAVAAGVWGLTFIVVFVAALLAEAAAGRRRVHDRMASLSIAVAVAFAPSAIPFAEATGRPIDVAAIQVDFRDLTRRASRTQGDLAVTRANLQLHRTLGERPPDLAIWGESALDPGSIRILDTVRLGVSAVGVPLLAGSTSVDVRRAPGRGPLFNQAVMFDAEGGIAGTYRKTHLVPFGEYIPWKPIVGWVSALDRIPYELAPGDRVRALSAPGLPRVGTPICFENAFPELGRGFVRDGASFLVVLTNNASYGETAASAQHLQMSRMRAIETGRWIVHAAVSGISAFIDPMGRVYQQTHRFEPRVIRRTIRASYERTIYVRLGDWLPLSTIVAVLAFALSSAHCAVMARRTAASRSGRPRPRHPGPFGRGVTTRAGRPTVRRPVALALRSLRSMRAALVLLRSSPRQP
jgi:apolipoprotein N-acyltransferase